MPKNTGRRTFFRASSEARRRKNYGRTPCLVAHPRARPHALPHARVLPETHPRVSQTRRTPSNASRFVHPARARPPRTHDTKMAACSLVATPVALRAPAVNRARGRASLRCNAAAKGIAGDGRVKLCLSKEDFDAANAEAGDNLVRDRPPRPRVTHPQPRERARLDKHSQRGIFCGFSRLPRHSLRARVSRCSFFLRARTSFFF
jgi:hypothetical protein